MTALVRYDAACRALAEARSLDEAKDIHDRAIAMQAYARQAKNKDLEVDAAEIRWRAEHRLGRLLTEQKAAIGLNGGALLRGSTMAPRDERPTLADAGIDKKLSSRAQTVAAIPDTEFDGLLATRRVNEIPRYLKRTAREAKHRTIAEKARLVIHENRVFSLIYADPPWLFANFGESGKDRTSADNYYPTLTYDEIKAFRYGKRSIADIAAPNALLFMWCTPANLVLALDVVKAWGFEYRSHLVWIKNKAGTGFYARQRHEPLLICARGNHPMPLVVPESVIFAPRGRHSAKPPEARALLESMFPHYDDSTRIELFARGRVPGWSVHGYESESGGAP